MLKEQKKQDEINAEYERQQQKDAAVVRATCQNELDPAIQRLAAIKAMCEVSSLMGYNSVKNALSSAQDSVSLASDRLVDQGKKFHASYLLSLYVLKRLKRL
jgi:hypothetical protein